METKKTKVIFLDFLSIKLREKSFKKEQIDAEREAQQSPSAPIGFNPPKQDASVEDTAPMDHIGFIEPSDIKKSFKKSDINQIVLNVQAGEFRVLEDTVRQPAGF